MPENTKPIKDENPDTVLDLQAEGDGESDEVEAHAGNNCVSLVSVVEK